jgi:GH24 family phage-related lysozyme (muramidase)
MQRKVGEIQTKESSSNSLERTPDIEIRIQSLQGRGLPLPESVRSYFEPRFGYDFGDVRVHTDATAAEAARSINALAFTLGEHVVFGAGGYSPDSTNGRYLLAHELAHTVQQRLLQHNILQRENDGSGGAPGSSNEGQEGSGGGGPVPSPETKPEQTPEDAPPSSAPPRSLSETLDPEKLMRNELIEEIQLINAWFASHTVSEPEASLLTEAKAALESEFNRTGGRCPLSAGPPKYSHPPHVSDHLIDHITGKYKPEDQGEGCKEYPYVASPYEGICTIGYGHQIREIPCPILDSAGDEEDIGHFPPNKPPSERRKKIAFSYWKSTGTPFPEFYCGCSKHIDCRGPEAKAQVKKDLKPNEDFVHKNVPFDLDQQQFDAMVDWVISGAWDPKSDLIKAMKLYWCSNAGKNYVRSIFLRSGITVKGSKEIIPGLVARRKYRVWPESPSESLPDDTPADTPIQPKLRIGQRNDIYEHEADRVADLVTSIPDSAIQPKPT